MDEFYQKAAEILEIETIGSDTVLRDCDAWDSLTALSLVAMADKYFKVTITADELMQAVTAGDLHKIVMDKSRSQ